MKKISIILSFVVVIACYNSKVLAQSGKDGSMVLEEAKRLYEDGEADNIHAMLKPYLEKGLSNKERKEAYRLVTLAYLFDDHKQEATKVLREFMRNYPEFDTTENDPNDLKYLFSYKGFEPKIVFSFGVIGGINQAKPSVIESYNANEGITSPKIIHSKKEMMYGAQFNARITNHVDIRLDALYSKNSYNFEQAIGIEETTNYSETLTQITVPIWISPYINYQKHRVFLKVGGGINYVFNAKADAKFTQPGINMILPDIDIIDKRASMTYFIGGGLGVSLKIPRGFITIDASYLNGLSNVVNEDSRTYDDILANSYFYVDDNFKLNNMMLSISYVLQFYKLKDQIME